MATKPSKDRVRTLPYSETPAQTTDVAKEVTTLAALVASVVVAGGSAEMLEDHTKEPGQSILIAETRLALALDSLIGAEQTFLIESMGNAMQTVLDEAEAGE